MRTTPVMLAAAFGLLSACSRSETLPEAREPAAPPSPAAAPAETPAATTRYVGRWAASEDMCDAGAWVFEAQGLTTAGEVACEFRAVRETPPGYEVDAVCTAEAPPKPYRIRLSFAESAGGMLVEGGPFQDMGLVRCGPPPPLS